MTREPWRPRKVIDLELADCLAGREPLADLIHLDGYAGIWALIRLHGTPIGTIEAPVVNGRCSAAALGSAILAQHADRIVLHVVHLSLGAPMLGGRWDPASLLALRPPPPPERLPSMTVAVCTRDRPGELAHCLEALSGSSALGLDVLVVDNAPLTDGARRLLADRFPEMRYVTEPRPGLDWARNRAILEASGEIVAFTDDDAVVDGGWAGAVRRVFAEQPSVMLVTGPVVPLELETQSQQLFEDYGGFGRGFRRRLYRADRAVGHHRPAQFGTGANMAFRREIFSQIGGFDPALDVGTPTNGGGDLEMFFRVLQEGYTVAYEPDSLVRHRHRADMAALDRQIAGWGTAFFTYAARSWTAYPGERLALAAVGARWAGRWLVRRAGASLIRPTRHPWRLALAELRGAAGGPAAWRRSRRAAAEIAERFGPQGLEASAAPRAKARDRARGDRTRGDEGLSAERWRALHSLVAQRLAPAEAAMTRTPEKSRTRWARNLLPWARQ